MKRILFIFIILFLLLGCSNAPKEKYKEETKVEREKITYIYTVDDITYGNIKLVIQVIEDKWHGDKPVKASIDSYDNLIFTVEEVFNKNEIPYYKYEERKEDYDG